MFEALNNLRTDNANDFKQRYGKIIDKKTAISALCCTSNAWLVITDSLKRDPEVIMYYQPMGLSDVVLYEDENGNYKEVYSTPLAQKGFRLTTSGEQIPNILLPEDFDMDMYIEIQHRLAASQNTYPSSVIGNMSRKMKNIEFEMLDWDKVFSSMKNYRRKMPDLVDRYYSEYIREELYRIVETVTSEKKQHLK